MSKLQTLPDYNVDQQSTLTDPCISNVNRLRVELDFRARFAISTVTVRYGQYITVRQVAGTLTARYRAVPPKIDRQRSIDFGRRRSIEQEKGKKKKRKKKKKKVEKKNTYRPRAVLARAPSPPAGAFTPAREERSRRLTILPKHRHSHNIG
ncbi:hypothetical protein GW17_00052751 [Ensete ventricosum]|nr:hypothetical protein GW17_00052751 [Ensete ventricosum]